MIPPYLRLVAPAAPGSGPIPATCPSWCNGLHPRTLIGPDEPDHDPARQPYVCHSTELARCAGLVVELTLWERHPAVEPDTVPAVPTVALVLDALADDVPLAQLDAWADTLSRAHRRAHALTEGTLTP